MDSLHVQLYSVAGVLIALSTSAALARYYVRIRMLKSFGVDDYLMAASTVSDYLGFT